MLVKQVLLYIWQLPQNILGLILVRHFPIEFVEDFHDVKVYATSRMFGGISLGRYIICSCPKVWTSVPEIHKRHEYGHCIQSRLLGWFYLPTVGLVSGIRAWLNLYKPGHYYDSWPENWADRLGGVNR